MKTFETINDVEEWLEPLEYEAFWQAVQPYALVLQPRDHCDQQIRDGAVDQGTVLDVLKYFARLEMTSRYNLSRRIDVPWID